MKPFLGVDKEKVRKAHPYCCDEHLFGHGPCHPIASWSLGATSWGADAERSVDGSSTNPSVFSQVQIYNPAFFKYIHDRWTEHHGRYPSTGMLVLFFALHVCDEVGDSSFGSSSGLLGPGWHRLWLLGP